MPKKVTNLAEKAENKSFKDRKHAFIIYPDAENYDCETILKAVESNFPEWSYVLHDLDCDDEGALLKPHYHVLVQFDNPRTQDEVRRKANLPPDHYIEITKHYKSALKYLLHRSKDAYNKYQYPYSALHTNCAAARQIIMGDGELAALEKIVDYIDMASNRYGSVSVTYLTRWVMSQRDASIWSAYRRNYSIIIPLLNKEV